MWAFGFPTAALAWAGVLYDMTIDTALRWAVQVARHTPVLLTGCSLAARTLFRVQPCPLLPLQQGAGHLPHRPGLHHVLCPDPAHPGRHPAPQSIYSRAQGEWRGRLGEGKGEGEGVMVAFASHRPGKPPVSAVGPHEPPAPGPRGPAPSARTAHRLGARLPQLPAVCVLPNSSSHWPNLPARYSGASHPTANAKASALAADPGNTRIAARLSEEWRRFTTINDFYTGLKNEICFPQISAFFPGHHAKAMAQNEEMLRLEQEVAVQLAGRN